MDEYHRETAERLEVMKGLEGDETEAMIGWVMAYKEIGVDPDAEMAREFLIEYRATRDSVLEGAE